MDIEEKTSKSCIDWEQAIHLTGGKHHLAQELLSMFVQTINTELTHIKKFYEQQALLPLYDIIHKLHGSISYCGLPALKHSIKLFETAIKLKNSTDITSAYENFLAETKKLQQEYKTLKD